MGNFNKNLTCAGAAIVVGGTTYDYNSLGLHLLATADNQDVVYDISDYSANYPYFVMEVAQPADGNNNIDFEVLVDGEVKDTFRWIGSTMSAAGKPVVMRAYVKDAQTLTLRSRWAHTDYANGTFVYLNVRLQKETLADGYVNANRILERANSTDGGWSEGYGTKVIFDRQHNNNVFDFPIYADHLIYEEGLATHLVNGTTYEENKVNSYITWKWDISSFNFSSFSALAYSQSCHGFHVDAWVDGVEVYTSGLINSVDTEVHYQRDPKLAPREINFAIPSGAQELELHIVADTVFNSGMIQLMAPTFFVASDNLISHSATQDAGDVWPFSAVRTKMWDGKQADIYYSETDEVKTVKDGFFFVAGDSESDGASYTFDISNVSKNSLVGVLGKAGSYYYKDERAGNVTLHSIVTYEDGTTETMSTEAISWTNSGVPVQIAHWGENAKTLKIYLTGDMTSWSETVLTEAKFVDLYKVSFTDGAKVESSLVEPNSALAKPTDPSKTGYEFNGWVLDGESDVYDFASKTVTANMSFTAKYTANKYAVSYKQALEDGATTDVTYAPTEYSYDTALSLPTPNTVANYLFDGWYVGELKVESLAKESYLSDIVVTAKYTLVRYEVSFDGASSEVKINSAIAKPDDPTKVGHTFGGWALEGESTAYDFTDKTVTSDLSFVSLWTVNSYTVTYKQQLGDAEATVATGYTPATRAYDQRFDMPEAQQIAGHTFIGWFFDDLPVEYISANSEANDITVVAKYSVDAFKVTFYNGEEKVGEQTVVYNQLASQPDDIVLQGYSFDGWFTEADELFDFGTPVQGALSLYAKLSICSYNVAYTHKLGSSVAPADGYTPTTHVYGTATTLPTAKTIEGYTFQGWYVNGTKVTSLGATDYLANIVVEGRYTLNSYTVTFVSEGVETNVNYDHGQKVSRPLEREGYDFDGWFTDKDCKNAYDASKGVTASITLYAGWTKQANATPWIIAGSVVGAGGIGVALFFILRKKKLGA